MVKCILYSADGKRERLDIHDLYPPEVIYRPVIEKPRSIVKLGYSAECDIVKVNRVEFKLQRGEYGHRHGEFAIYNEVAEKKVSRPKLRIVQ